jgi:hypothetical protein
MTAFRAGAHGAHRYERLHFDQRCGEGGACSPSHIRALGVALPYAIANAVFGGSAEYVALQLKALGQLKAPSTGMSPAMCGRVTYCYMR